MATEHRKLATVETIAEVEPIVDADAIVRARVRGWDVVVKKGEYAPGDLCVYFEVDSLLDVQDPRFEFLAARGVRTDAAGNTGHVLKTARLRGQYSQGLVVAAKDFPELGDIGAEDVGKDVTEILGIIKWEAPIPASLAGEVKGGWPGWIPKTDEERIQNIPEILEAQNYSWVATEKLDGSSTTFFVDGEEDGVCSRNLNLRDTEKNTLWILARKLNIHELLRASGADRIAVQGETYGEGIQKNPLKVHGQNFAAFNLVIDGKVIPRDEWPTWLKDMSVPERDLSFPKTLEEALAQVDKIKSAVTPEKAAEGIVWRATGTDFVKLPDGKLVKGSFKAISNSYLLKHDT